MKYLFIIYQSKKVWEDCVAPKKRLSKAPRRIQSKEYLEWYVKW